MKTISNDLITEVTRRLVAEFHPEQVILFGSYAWGTPNEDSDLDLLVIVPRSEQKPVQRAVRAYHSLHNIPVPIDVLVKTRAEVERYRPLVTSLERQILDHGKVLYG